MNDPITDRELFTQVHMRLRGAAVQKIKGPAGEEFIGGRYIPVSDRRVIETILRIANMHDWQDFVHIHSAIQRGVTATYSTDSESLPSLVLTFTDPKIGKEWQDLYADTFAEYKSEQKRLLPILEQISEDLPAARSKLATSVSKQLAGVVVVTLPEFRGGQLLMEPFPYLPTIKAAVGYGLGLLLDEGRPANEKRTFGERLRRCAYGADESVENACGKWFLSFAAESGGPMPKYCSEICSAKAIADGISARVTRHRARKAK
jgi:hypothetical protein